MSDEELNRLNAAHQETVEQLESLRGEVEETQTRIAERRALIAEQQEMLDRNAATDDTDSDDELVNNYTLYKAVQRAHVSIEHDESMIETFHGFLERHERDIEEVREQHENLQDQAEELLRRINLITGSPEYLLAALDSKQISEEDKKKHLQCCICLLGYKLGAMVKICTGCQQIYHEECISKWLGQKVTCPHCRCDYQARRIRMANINISSQDATSSTSSVSHNTVNHGDNSEASTSVDNINGISAEDQPEEPAEQSIERE